MNRMAERNKRIAESKAARHKLAEPINNIEQIDSDTGRTVWPRYSISYN